MRHTRYVPYPSGATNVDIPAVAYCVRSPPRATTVVAASVALGQPPSRLAENSSWSVAVKFRPSTSMVVDSFERLVVWIRCFVGNGTSRPADVNVAACP